MSVLTGELIVSRLGAMSRSLDHVVDRERSWYAGERRPSLFSAGVWIGLVALALALFFSTVARRSPAELALDRWAEQEMRAVSWRRCHDDQPLPDGMVRCEVGFQSAGRGLIYCPGERSAEQNCRWL